MVAMYDQHCVPALQLVGDSSTRGHSYKLRKSTVTTSIRAHSFIVRVINTWNSLPESVVTAPSVNSFKGRLDTHWASQAILYDYKADLSLGRTY